LPCEELLDIQKLESPRELVTFAVLLSRPQASRPRLLAMIKTKTLKNQKRYSDFYSLLKHCEVRQPVILMKIGFFYFIQAKQF